MSSSDLLKRAADALDGGTPQENTSPSDFLKRIAEGLENGGGGGDGSPTNITSSSLLVGGSGYSRTINLKNQESNSSINNNAGLLDVKITPNELFKDASGNIGIAPQFKAKVDYNTQLISDEKIRAENVEQALQTNKQEKLIAGANITIDNNVISSPGGGGSSGVNSLNTISGDINFTSSDNSVIITNDVAGKKIDLKSVDITRFDTYTQNTQNLESGKWKVRGVLTYSKKEYAQWFTADKLGENIKTWRILEGEIGCGKDGDVGFVRYHQDTITNTRGLVFDPFEAGDNNTILMIPKEYKDVMIFLPNEEHEYDMQDSDNSVGFFTDRWSENVSSVNGKTGDVVLTGEDIKQNNTEGAFSLDFKISDIESKVNNKIDLLANACGMQINLNYPVINFNIDNSVIPGSDFTSNFPSGIAKKGWCCFFKSGDSIFLCMRRNDNFTDWKCITRYDTIAQVNASLGVEAAAFETTRAKQVEQTLTDEISNMKTTIAELQAQIDILKNGGSSI